MLIQCKNLTKSYQIEEKRFDAVNNVSFEVAKGEFIVILGHSGSGKTTLLSLIGGLTRPDQGEIYIHNTANWPQSDRALSRMRNKTIGFIFQFASLIPTLSVMENMLLPLSFGENQRHQRPLAQSLIDQIGLADKVNALPAHLSGGQQRRVAIARAFMSQPDIILADEPTGDLDEETENDILKLFRDYNQKGTTFLVVTHNRRLGESQINPRIMSMRQGIITEGCEPGA